MGLGGWTGKECGSFHSTDNRCSKHMQDRRRIFACFPPSCVNVICEHVLPALPPSWSGTFEGPSEDACWGGHVGEGPESGCAGMAPDPGVSGTPSLSVYLSGPGGLDESQAVLSLSVMTHNVSPRPTRVLPPSQCQDLVTCVPHTDPLPLAVPWGPCPVLWSWK